MPKKPAEPPKTAKLPRVRRVQVMVTQEEYSEFARAAHPNTLSTWGRNAMILAARGLTGEKTPPN